MPPVASLIGAPTDVGASVRGSSMGPEALRVAGIVDALQRRGVGVYDAGNLVGPANPSLPAERGFRHLHQCISWNRLVHDAVAEALGEGRMPILLGGDHSVGIGSISAVVRHCRATGRPLRVLWLDAHADSNTAEITPSGNLHGMPVACLHGHGPEALTMLSGARPALAPGQLIQVGIRSVDDEEKAMIEALGLEVFDMRQVDEMGMRSVMEQALVQMAPGTHLHVSLDADFLDPSIAPGVGTGVKGGPTYREAQLCMEMIADTGCLASLDVVEVNPALDERNRTAELVVELVESLFGKRTLMRRG
jgi:arginase